MSCRFGITPTVRTLAVVTAFLPFTSIAYESGSTGADGAFNPTVDTVLPLPPDGIFNFTNVNIPAGVTVTFQRNDINTPVTLLASGDAIISGTLHVNGGWSAPVGAAGDGNIGDDGLPGIGGPGGYDGGRGGEAGKGNGGAGHGPGGAGSGGFYYSRCPAESGTVGGGGGFGVAGKTSQQQYFNEPSAHGGIAYGSELLLPLVGGSGGGGAGGGTQFHGSGGGAGGGALLIAASGTVRITNTTGAIRADGGNSGDAAGIGVGGTGGGGSGGAIRIVATTIDGNGAITARAGQRGVATSSYCYGGNGGEGRIRLEAENFTRTTQTIPAYSFGDPAPISVAGLPGLRITRVAGIDAPASPTGSGDIVLPADVPNPVTVEFQTNGVPVGNTVRLTVTPAYGNATEVISPALDGSTDLAMASVSVDLPEGPSVLFAQTSYTVIESVGDELSIHTNGERVESIRLAAGFDGSSQVTLVTVSGKEFTLPSNVAAMPMS